MENSQESTALLLELPEIAAWQIALALDPPGKIVADLPALQRGAVWKVAQIEELWDSVMRGFPIGAFILSPPNDELLRQDYKHQAENPSRPKGTHLLLDGQQRATAVAIAFDDVWSRRDDLAKGALWVDLAEASESRQVAFVFRVLTRAHPWGYRRNNPEEVLSSSAVRAALCAYQAVHACPDRRPEDFTLWQTWPWDANVPLPVAPLIAAVLDHPGDTDAALTVYWEHVSRLPFIAADTKFSVDDERKVTEARYTLEKQRQAVDEAFKNVHSSLHGRLQLLVRTFEKVLLGKRRYRVPGLLLDVGSIGADGGALAETAKDAIELLFIRVNSAGTPLAGEELIYSLIKAEWPEVAQWMQKLQKDGKRPALASRVASLCVRLVLARHRRQDQNTKSNLPQMPSINEFRRLLSNENANQPDFKKRLKEFIDQDAARLFSQAWDFLALPKPDSDKAYKPEQSFRLLPVQVCDLAQNSPDVYLLLLRWIDRLTQVGIPLSKIDEKVHRRTLGFLTALAWFSFDKGKACASIWADLDADLDEQKLKDRFNSTRFKAACRISERSALQMIPLPRPEELASACGRFIYHNGTITQTKEEATIHFSKGSFWSDKNWWYGQFSTVLAKLLNRGQDWQQRLTFKTSEDVEAPDYLGLVEQAAQHFLDTLWRAKSTILLYAQRQSLQRWYRNFDPSQPEMMEDKNRPWDIDHILAQNYFSGLWGIPQSVKDWGGSIGNLRAWPLEANRSDSDTSPKKKLTTVSAEEKRYGISTKVDKMRDSFVASDDFEKYWANAVPIEDDSGEVVSQSRYLSNDYAGEYDDNRVAAITAIVLRFNALYRNWYEELRISDLH